MKILAIGDPHGDLKKIKKINADNVDLIILTGDLGDASLMRKMAFYNIDRRKRGLPEKEFSPRERKKAYMQAYNSSIAILKYLSRIAPVYTIFGNVEMSDKEAREYSKELGLPIPSLVKACNKMRNVKIINNKLVKFKGKRIGGLEYFVDDCWVKIFKPSNYAEAMISAALATMKASKILRKFGKIDVLVCHQPPYGKLDKVTSSFAPKHWQGKHAGSKLILDYIRRKSPRYVFCGHIHEGEGMVRIGKSQAHNLGVANHIVVDI